MKPDLCTFVGNEHRLRLAIEHGADHVILEDTKLSARSYAETVGPGFNHLKEWAQIARSINPDIQLSFNLDILVHERHFPLIKTLINTLKEAHIHRIRIQDPGLYLFIQHEMPEASVDLSTETGNQNLESIGYFSKKFSRQVLSNEMPYSELKNTLNTFPEHAFEIQIHGPILIQYSNRRYLLGKENESDHIVRFAQDQQYPNRHYRFYDNPHGHFMYLYFDRCLLPYMTELRTLPLARWLIDGRGESDPYLTQALRLFKKYRDSLLSPDTSDISLLQKVAVRPLKGGFFRANYTDQDRETVVKSYPGFTFAGTVIHTESKKQFYIEHFLPILTRTLMLVTPEGKQIHFTADNSSTLSNSITCFPWQKGVVTQSKVFIQSL